MSAVTIDNLGTLLVALVSVPALLVALRQLRQLRRIEWLRSRITSDRRILGGGMRDSDIDMLTADGAQ